MILPLEKQDITIEMKGVLFHAYRRKKSACHSKGQLSDF